MSGQSYLAVLSALGTSFLKRYEYSMEQYPNPDFFEVSGRSEQHLGMFGEQRVHASLVEPLAQLADAARSEGFELGIASGWRSYDRQLAIWNQKASGQRVVLDVDGQPLNTTLLDDESLMWAILRWSALPGGSRHHWGTEVDIFEHSSMPEGYRLQLTTSETYGDGPFARFYLWLDSHLSLGGSRFFRPYTSAGDGVAPEPWHLSYAPTAAAYQRALNLDALRALIEASEMALKAVVLDNLEEVYARFIWVDWARYPDLN